MKSKASRWSGKTRCGAGRSRLSTSASGEAKSSKRRTWYVVRGAWLLTPRTTHTFLAVLVERSRKVRRNILGIPSLDIAPFQHEHELPVLKQRDLRCRWRVPGEITPRARRGVRVLPGEHG